MRKIFCLVMFVLAIVSAQAQYHLEKYYFGTLYIGAIPANENYYRLQNDNFPLAGVKVKFPVMSGNVRMRVLHDLNSGCGQAWWEKDMFSAMNFKIGYMPRPVGMVNKPEPVSAENNFIFASQSVIPGSSFGMLIKNSFQKTELIAGVYKTSGGDSLEIGFGFQQSINFLGLKKTGISGYSNKNGSNGVALNAETENISLMFFKGEGINSEKTYSGFINIFLADSVFVYTDIVYQQEKWQRAEIALCKNFSERIGITNVNYLIGAGYAYSEVVPKSINFYLQIWLDKE